MQITDAEGMATYYWMQQTTWQRLLARRTSFCISGVQARTWCHSFDPKWHILLHLLRLMPRLLALHAHTGDIMLPLQSDANHSSRHFRLAGPCLTSSGLRGCSSSVYVYVSISVCIDVWVCYAGFRMPRLQVFTSKQAMCQTKQTHFWSDCWVSIGDI